MLDVLFVTRPKFVETGSIFGILELRVVGGVQRIHPELQREPLAEPEVALDIRVEAVQTVAAHAIHSRRKDTRLKRGRRSLWRSVRSHRC